MPASALSDLLGASLEPEAFVRRALGLLEADFRVLALRALADWQRLGIVSSELFSAVASLQRPSWGSWNGLLTALRNARKGVLRAAGPAERARLEDARTLARALALLDEAVDPALATALKPLGDLTHTKVGSKVKLGLALTLPIALRNRVAHDSPSESSWWAVAASALRPLALLHVEKAPLAIPREGPLPAPWLLEEGGETWAFNGLGQDFSVLYVSAGGVSRATGEQSQAVLLAFEQLLGKADQKERDVRKLLAKLAPEEIKGVVLGDYLLGRPVGAGGFATVHVGRQLSTGRKVALKVLNDGLSEDSKTRFQQEAAFLARFDHPNIVRVLGHGEETWSPPRLPVLAEEAWFQGFARSAPVKTFMVLEWLEGETLDGVWKRAKPLDPGPRVLAEWFAQAAGALASVHAAGLIHRDVKPANLMLTSEGTVKLMDFGIARTQSENRTLATETGTALGTPAYMSPEQVRSVDAEAGVGPGTDVYSLSATFYELFTRRRIFHHDRESMKLVETRKLAGERPERPRLHARAIGWDLETILLGGLEPEVADRYPTAAALERDLRHYLRDEPIEYRRPSLARRLRLAYRRNRTVANLVALFIAVVVTGTALSFRSLEQERARTYSRMVEAQVAAFRAETSLAEADMERLWDLRARTTPLHARAVGEAAAALVSRVNAIKTPAEGDVALAGRALARVRLSAENAALDAAGMRLSSGPLGELGWVRPFESVAVSPDGKLLAAGEGSRTPTTLGIEAPMSALVFVWELGTGKLVRTVAGPRGGGHDQLAFGPDGTLYSFSKQEFSTGSGRVSRIPVANGTSEVVLREGARRLAVSPDGRTLLGAGLVLDARGGRVVKDLAGAEKVEPLGFSPDGRLGYFQLAEHETLRIVDLASGEARSVEIGDAHRAAALSPDSRAVVVPSTHVDVAYAETSYPFVRILETETGRELARLDVPDVLQAVFSPDGREVLLGADGRVMLWDPASGACRALPGPTGLVEALAFSPDGALAIAAAEGIWVWERATGKLVRSWANADLVGGAFVSGDELLAAGSDGSLRWWDTRTGRLRLGVETGARLARVSIASDRGELATGGVDGSVELRDARTGALLAALGRHEGKVTGIACSPTSEEIASVSTTDRTLRLWDRSGLVRRIDLPPEPVGCAFAPGGDAVIAAVESAILVFERQTGALVRTLATPASVSAIACGRARDGSDRVAAGQRDGRVSLFDLADGHLVGACIQEERRDQALLGVGNEVTALVFANGELLAGDWQGVLRVLDAESGRVVARWEEPAVQDIGALVVSPDGGRVVLEQRGVLRVRDRSSLGAGLLAKGGGRGYPATGVSPDGKVVLGPGGDGRLGLLDAATGRLLARSEARAAMVATAGFGPSGEVIASSVSGAVLLDGRTGETLRRFEHPAKAMGCAISPDGRAVALTGGDLIQVFDREGSLAWKRPTRGARTVAFSPDGRAVLAGGEGLLLLERGTGSVVRSFLGEGEPVVCACFSPDGREVLAALTKERTFRLYDVATGECVRTLLGNTMPVISCAFSRDGQLIASTSMERVVRLWDRGSGRLIRTLDPGGNALAHLSCAFSPGGERLYAVDLMGNLRVWDLGRPFPFDVVFAEFARDPEGAARRAFDAIDLHERPWEPTEDELPRLEPRPR